MKLALGICLAAAFHVSHSFRVVRSGTRQRIECTLEAFHVDWENADGQPDEVGACESADGTQVLLNFADIEHLESGDHVSLAIASDDMSVAALPQAMGKPVHRAFDILVLNRPKIESIPSVASTWRPSILMVETRWSDGSRSASNADIRASSVQMLERFRNDSYGEFLPTIEYMSANIPRGYKTFAASEKCHAGSARDIVVRDVPAVAAKRRQHHFVMVFLPTEPVCGGGGWAGVATTGCGKPRDKPPAPLNGCWVVSRQASAYVQGHELGHNLGLGHAAGWDRNSKMVEYGDRWGIMGSSYSQAGSFSAAARNAIGWLPSGQGGALPAQSGHFVLGDVDGPLNPAGADGVAVMIACTDCRPYEKGGHNGREHKGGHLFVSYLRKDRKVAVHFARSGNGWDNGGTESWAELGPGESWKNPSTANAVHVCELSGNLVRVGVGSSATAARSQCSKAPSPRPTPRPNPAPTFDLRSCRRHCQRLGHCCKGNPPVGSNMFLSCYQACSIRSRGLNATQCQSACDAPRDCDRVVAGKNFDLCGTCDDGSCSFGVPSTQACHDGCSFR